jgi:hypothetical protein
MILAEINYDIYDKKLSLLYNLLTVDPTKINAHWLKSALGQSERRKGTMPSLLPDPIKISPPRLPRCLIS